MMKLPHLFHFLTKERHGEVLDELETASSPKFDYFLLVILSCSIATFGLITNSTAVIIGAMLVAPLMSPILGLSLASVAESSDCLGGREPGGGCPVGIVGIDRRYPSSGCLQDIAGGDFGQNPSISV
jgi:hypothetical protein